MYLRIVNGKISQMQTPEAAVQLFLSVGLVAEEQGRIPIPADVEKQNELVAAARESGLIEPNGRWNHLIEYLEGLDGANGHIKNEGGTLLFTYPVTDTNQTPTE